MNSNLNTIKAARLGSGSELNEGPVAQPGLSLPRRSRPLRLLLVKAMTW